jgi:CRP/FNR family transcriptional regulator, cyclic AMP receptor protein
MDENVHHKLNSYFAQFPLQKLKKKSILIQARDPEAIYYLTKGAVRMYAVSRNGEEITLNTFKSPSFFPMNWALNKGDNNYYYETIESIEFRKSPPNQLVQFLSHEPEILLDLLKRIYRGLDGVMSRMEYLMAGNAKGRLLTELIIYAKRFGSTTVEGKVTISLNLTQKDLASQTGIARETVSRELTKLKDKGLIRVHDKTISINNLHDLEKELLV